MLTDRIIGRVGAEILSKRLANPAQAGDSVALFRLDKLSPSQVAAVARAVPVHCLPTGSPAGTGCAAG